VGEPGAEGKLQSNLCPEELRVCMPGRTPGMYARKNSGYVCPEKLRVCMPGKTPGYRTGCIVSEKGLFGEGNLFDRTNFLA